MLRIPHAALAAIDNMPVHLAPYIDPDDNYYCEDCGRNFPAPLWLPPAYMGECHGKPVWSDDIGSCPLCGSAEITPIHQLAYL